MKLFIPFLMMCFSMMLTAQVGINTTTPSSAAILDVNGVLGVGNYGGFLPPRLNESQRDAISVSAADDGLQVFVTKANGERCLQMYNGVSSTWENITCIGRIIFFESMGRVLSNTFTTFHHALDGFDNSYACNFNSTTSTQSQIRMTAPTSRDVNFGLSGASGGGSLFFVVGNRDFIIENINISAFTGPFTLQMLIHKDVEAANGSELTIQYYDGSNWQNLPFTMPTGAGSAKWHKVVLSSTISTIERISVVRANAGSATYRIDDIEILKN